MDKQQEERLRQNQQSAMNTLQIDHPNIIRKYQEEYENAPLLYRGWLCRLPTIDKVWLTGSMPMDPNDNKVQINCHLLFKNGSRHDFKGDTEDQVIAAAESFLQNLKQKGE